MANTRSARKAVRQIERRTAVNKARRTRMRTFVKKAEEALLGNNLEVARAAFRQAESVLMHAVTQGIIHKNSAARKVSRLASRFKRLTQAAA